MTSLADDGMAADWTKEMIAIVIAKSCIFAYWLFFCWKMEELMLKMENYSLFIVHLKQIHDVRGRAVELLPNSSRSRKMFEKGATLMF